MLRRFLTLFFAWALVLGAPLQFAPQAHAQVTVDATKTRSAFSTTTWSGIAAASTVPAGTLAYVTDLGENGSFVLSNGTRWRAVNGEAALKTLPAAVAGIANVENIVLQTTLPAGSWQPGDVIRIGRLALTKSGTTDLAVITVRVGTACTTADTAITGLSAFTALSAATVAGGFDYDVRLISATSAQRVGNNSAGSSGFGAASSGAAAAATTISSTATNVLCVSVGIRSSSTTNTVGIDSGAIQLITP